jgi:hypothetical protein
LLAGVSACAIVIAAPAQLTAGERTPPSALLARAQAAIQPKWAWWIEGGPSYLGGGNTYVPGFTNPPFAVSANGWGGEVAAGFDEHFQGIWHLSGQFRYGWYGPRSNSSNPLVVFQVGGGDAGSTATVIGTNSADRKETHWLADFMVGRDLGLGGDLSSTARFGVRIADISSKTTGHARWIVPNVPTFATLCATAPTAGRCIDYRRDYTQYNTFFGVGPRFQFNGIVPLAPRWAIDYMFGIADLYGHRKTSQGVAVSQSGATFFFAPVTPVCFGNCPNDAAASDNAWVFNADAMIGLAYAITTNCTFMVSYRFDGYWKALKGFDATGQPVDLDRFYNGVMVRLTLNN